MPVNVQKGQVEQTKEYAGLTAGNGAIIRVPSGAKDVAVEYFPTAAGTAALKLSLGAAIPTDFTGFMKAPAGDVTAATMHRVSAGVQWVGLDPASGTWTLRVSFK